MTPGLALWYPREGLGAIPLGIGHPHFIWGTPGGIFPRYTGG
ncbi:hypothetical protein [Pseudomonas phage PaeP_Ls]|nr:hypothetical protein [Pseudomonas phage PaeP_Ls]